MSSIPQPEVYQNTGIIIENIPEELKARRQWVAWKLEHRGSELTKVPYDPRSGRRARSNDLMTWVTFEEALAAVEAGHYAGVGFVLCSGDPYTGLDLDHCRDPETGEVAQWAKEIIETVSAYAEVSPSGEGVHLIVRGELPNSRREGVEVYSTRRFLTMTGRAL
jgi:putative DNA primase/helicase